MADLPIAQRLGAPREPRDRDGLGFEVPFGDVALHDGCELAFEAGDRRTVAKPTDTARELIASRRVAALQRRKRKRHIRPDVATHEAEALGHHPDHTVRIAVEPDALIEDARLPPEAAAP